MGILNNLIIKSTLIENIIEGIELKNYISIKLLFSAILLTYISYEIQKHYFEIKNENITEKDQEIIKNIEEIRHQINKLEETINKVSNNLNIFSRIVGKNLATIIKNTSYYFHTYQGSSFIDAITNDENKKEFSERKEAFFASTLDFLESLSYKDKATIYSHMKINPPVISFYKKNHKITLLEELCIENYLNLFSNISNKILQKFINPKENNYCINYCFSGPAGTGKTQGIYYIIQKIINNLDNDQEIVLLNITPQNIREANDFQIILSLIDHYEKQGKYMILFIDEIDSFIKNRKNNISSVGDQYDITTGMMQFIDKIKDADKKVSIFSATNHPENIDDAILRDGRNNHQRFYLPNTEERYEIIEKKINANEKISHLVKEIHDQYKQCFDHFNQYKNNGYSRDITFGIVKFESILAAFITILTVNLPITQTINTAQEILEKIVDFEKYEKLISANLGRSSSIDFWVNERQSKELPTFFDLKSKMQKILFILLHRADAKDLIHFITEDLFPVKQWFSNLTKDTINTEDEKVVQSLLSLSASQDAKFEGIKPSSIKYINPEKLCPHVNVIELLKYWNKFGRNYLYRNRTLQDKLQIQNIKYMSIQCENVRKDWHNSI